MFTIYLLIPHSSSCLNLNDFQPFPHSTLQFISPIIDFTSTPPHFTHLFSNSSTSLLSIIHSFPILYFPSTPLSHPPLPLQSPLPFSSTPLLLSNFLSIHHPSSVSTPPCRTVHTCSLSVSLMFSTFWGRSLWKVKPLR